MKLGELLMVRAQLQKDLQEQANLVTENAVRVVDDNEPPAHDAAEALRGYWSVLAKVRRVQHQIQDVNASERYDDQFSMAEALLERELLRKQLPTVTAMFKACSERQVYQGGEYVKCVPAVDLPELRTKLKDIKSHSQTMDVKLQGRNWEIDVQDPQ